MQRWRGALVMQRTPRRRSNHGRGRELVEPGEVSGPCRAQPELKSDTSQLKEFTIPQVHLANTSPFAIHRGLAEGFELKAVG